MTDQPQDAHRRLREQLGVHALGHGTPDERAAVQAHLDGCAACRAELAGLVPLTARLADVDPDRLDDLPAPPPELADAVLARIAAAGPRPADLAARRARRNRVRAAVAASVVAAAAFGGGWLARPLPPQPPLEPVAVEVDRPGVSATAEVVPHTWGVEVRLSGAGFTAGAVYRLTVRDDAGREVPAGQFLGVGAQELHCSMNSSVLRQDAAGFEVRDAAGALVLRSEL